MTSDELDLDRAPIAASRPTDGPRRNRRDPAAMRATLDAARRQLGPAGPTEDLPQTAAALRALLREAASNSANPLAPPVGTGATDPRPETAADDIAGLRGFR